MRVLAVIPARYASTRLPGKPLVDIHGKPMVQHVYERCRDASGVDRVIVATDDRRIEDACRSRGLEVELTSTQHVSGTDRVAEVASRHTEFDCILNVQGDEPGIEPQTVSAVARLLADPEVKIASAMTRFHAHESAVNASSVKVVTDGRGDALYFSRAAIPFYRGSDEMGKTYFRHLGIYGFKRDILSQLTNLLPSRLERAESLEQLRWLESGYRIRLVEVESASVGIDTPDDLAAFMKSSLSQIKSTDS